jgi:signal transduction histidine kinase
MATLHFKTNVLLKNLVGKDLINDDNIAVVELVKNAYDAGSKSVLIKFEGFDEKGRSLDSAKLIISDKGSGMGRADIADKWLNIAYSDKTNLQGEHGVYYAGNKGIGRFSCDRLGAHLDLLTRQKGGDIFHLDIPWSDFEVEGKKDLVIQSVDIDLKTVSDAKAAEIAGAEMPRHGTVLVISMLRSAWDRDKLLAMRRSLEKFLSPNQKFMRDTFQITVEAKGLKDGPTVSDTERVNGVVENEVFLKLQFNSSFIESAIDPDGKYVETVVRHEGEDVFRLTEKNALPLKNVRVVIYFLNPYKKAYFKRQTGFRSIDFGSVFLFLNGFRIAPYGDRGDDWLGLDLRKTQGTLRYLGSRDLVGRVEVFDDADLFKPISSREGLKKTDAFLALRNEFILEVIKRLEKFVVDGLDWDSIPDDLRTQMRAEEGLDWKKTTEEYRESWDRKRQRIALSIMTLIGSSPDRMVRFWFNPALLEGVYEQRVEEAQRLLSDIEGFDAKQIDSGLQTTLKRLRKLVVEKDQAASAARADADRLRVAVVKQKERISKLTKEGDTYRAQTLFLQSLASVDVKALTLFNHEIFSNSTIIENYIGKIAKALREISGTSKILENIEKLSLANKRIMAIAQFATKANFKSSTSKESTDIPTFVEQYVLNVAREFVGSGGPDLRVINAVKEPFEVSARRIELSILIDNIIRNSTKAQANRVDIVVDKKSANELILSFSDDGRGLSDAIKRPEDIFEFGVTTTSGSGLGLYHAKEIVKSLGGTIRAIPRKPRGLDIRVEMLR